MVEIMLGIFVLEGNPLLYEDIFILVVYCIECIKERYYERVKSKLQEMWCRLYPFILLDNRNEWLENFSMDVA